MGRPLGRPSILGAELKRVIGLCVTAALLLTSATAPAQNANPSSAARLPSAEAIRQSLRSLFPDKGGPCKISKQTAYDIRGFWYPATVRICGPTIEDISTGSLAIPPGMKLFYNSGRASLGNLYTLTRAKPNTAYGFYRNDKDEKDYRTLVPDKRGVWADVVRPLPFIPTALATYHLGDYTRYAYTGLKILKGQEHLAYPLNFDSVIVGVDGHLFGESDALPALMSYPDWGEQYVEIWYVQRSERPYQIRRTFIPILTQWGERIPWEHAARTEHVGERNRLGEVIGTVGAIVALAAIWQLAESSGFIAEYRRQREECLRRNEQYIVC